MKVQFLLLIGSSLYVEFLNFLTFKIKNHFEIVDNNLFMVNEDLSKTDINIHISSDILGLQSKNEL